MAHPSLYLLPFLGGTNIFFFIVLVPFGEPVGNILVQSQGAQHEACQLHTLRKFLLQLLGETGDVAFRNRKLPHPDQPVHLAGGFVAEQRRGLVEAHGQIPVAAFFVQVHLELERARHGAQGKDFFVILRVAQHKHPVAVVIPVAGNLVEVLLRHKRGFGEQVAALCSSSSTNR